MLWDGYCNVARPRQQASLMRRATEMQYLRLNEERQGLASPLPFGG
jgi:hypothetical protein